MAQQHKVGTHKTKVFTEGQTTKVIYHSTAVVTFTADIIKLDTGGWESPTTKTRMNQASNEFNLGFRVFQKDFNWFCEYNGETLEFSPDGTLELSRGETLPLFPDTSAPLFPTKSSIGGDTFEHLPKFREVCNKYLAQWNCDAMEWLYYYGGFVDIWGVAGILDLLGFVEYAEGKNIEGITIAATIAHDLSHMKDDCFLPRTTDYKKHLSYERGE